MFYLFKTPYFIQKLFPNYLWRKNTDKKVIYLTFDDGPTPAVTPWILETLKKFDAKASFFCIGKNVVLHPKIVNSIIKQNHTIGNHTYSHINGWNVSSKTYLDDVERTRIMLSKSIESQQDSSFFRPAYGKISFKQSKALRNLGYKIVLWDVLSGDFDLKLSPEKSLKKVLKHTKPGSIVVFHDSIKAQKILQYVLPKALEYWKKEAYEFMAL